MMMQPINMDFSFRRLLIPVCTLIILATFGIAVGPAVANDGGRPLSALLFGAAEVPGPGDSDGTGKAVLRLNQGQGEICFEITVDDIATPTAAHIHIGSAGVAGPVVVNFNVAANGLSGCVDVNDPALIQMIRQDPSAFYVNVHNADFPPGAIRGQLEKGF